MSDANFQIIPKHVSNVQKVPIQFEEELTTLEQFWTMKQLEEEYYYELMMEEL